MWDMIVIAILLVGVFSPRHVTKNCIIAIILIIAIRLMVG
jgi:hypothetical protein